MALQGITDTQDGLTNENRKTLGVVALISAREDCNVQLTCVNQGTDEVAAQYARQQCVVVRDVLVRANRGRGWDKTNIFTSRQNPGNGLVAGMVYLSFI